MHVPQRFLQGKHLPKSKKYPVKQMLHYEFVQVKQLSIWQFESTSHLPFTSTLGAVQVAHFRGFSLLLVVSQVAQLGSQALQVKSVELYI